MKTLFCINSMIKKSLSFESKHFIAYLKMKEILYNGIFLILNLKRNIDFNYNDIDEAKMTYFIIIS